MLGEKFYISLSSLSTIELNSFIRYSKSNFLNKKKEITFTIELFKKNKEKFFTFLNKEQILFKKVFPNEKTFDRIRLKDLFHYSINLFEDFVVFYVSKTDDEQKLSILSKFYAKKNMQKEALAINTKLFKIVKKYKLNYKNYYKLFKLDMNRFEILLNDFNYETFQYAEKANELLDKYYFLEKLRITQELRSDSIMSSRKYKISFLNEIKNEIKVNEKINKKLLFKIYSITSDLYEGVFDKETYFILKKLVLKNIEKFDFFTRKMVFSDINNYLSILYNKIGDSSLFVEVFENYKNQIHYKTIIINNKIADADFSPIINISLALKEFDWTNNFIDKYSKNIQNKDLVLLNRAQILYVQKDYDKALETLRDVEPKTPKVNYELKAIYAKILYLTNEIDLLDSHLNAFELYIRRQKNISELVKNSNLKFILFSKRLVNNKVNVANLLKLKKDIEKDKSVFNRIWLLSELDKIIK